jgi:hypothetical protein
MRQGMSKKVLISGTLCKRAGSWLLNTGDGFIAITSSGAIEPTLENQKVSLVGKEEVAAMTGGGGGTFVAERVVSHDEIAARACAIYKSGKGGSAAHHWYLAEKGASRTTRRGHLDR